MNHHPLENKLLQCKLTAASIHECKDEYLEGSLKSCLFRKIIIIRSLTESVITHHLATGSWPDLQYKVYVFFLWAGLKSNHIWLTPQQSCHYCTNGLAILVVNVVHRLHSWVKLCLSHAGYLYSNSVLLSLLCFCLQYVFISSILSVISPPTLRFFTILPSPPFLAPYSSHFYLYTNCVRPHTPLRSFFLLPSARPLPSFQASTDPKMKPINPHIWK